MIARPTEPMRIAAATARDVSYVSERLRPEDRAGLKAVGFASVRASIQASFERALWCEVVKVDAKPAAIFGLSPSSAPDVGLPWMVCTSQVERLTVAGLRSCRPVVERMLRDRPALVNFVHAKNKQALRWLGWLGFSFDAPFMMPGTGEQFLPFHAGPASDSAARYIAWTLLAISPAVGPVQ